MKSGSPSLRVILFCLILLCAFSISSEQQADAQSGHGIVATTDSVDHYGAWIENTGPAGAKGAYIRSGTGYTADIVLGANDASGEGDDGSIACDRRYSGCDIVLVANDRVFVDIGRDANSRPGSYFVVQNHAGGLFYVYSNGRVVAEELEIVGGADLAEQFNVRSYKNIAPEPGLLVSIDPDTPGGLIVSSHEYERGVVGVISGAGNMKPGLVLHQEGTIADGEYPVSLTGRVYVNADASYGEIRPGDLLTTSSTPGHAKRVSDYVAAQGAIIGKAMTNLEKETGLVLVLVTLQ